MPQLAYEYRLYKLFEGNVDGIPKVSYFGREGDFNIMVMEILGPTLETLFRFCDRKFTEQTVAMLALQCIERVQYMHSKSFIHRDIKPENFLIGVGRKEQMIHIIDFGLSKRYVDPITGNHISLRKNKGMMGTLRFSSITSTKGHEQSRKDDLEALGYMFAYFLNGGQLPWMGMAEVSSSDSDGPCSKREELSLRRVREIKEQTTPDQLFPKFMFQPEFATYLRYCRNLGFEEVPDYKYLKDLFQAIIKR